MDLRWKPGGFEKREGEGAEKGLNIKGMSPTIYKMTCKHEFRGNAWICSMWFASWTYDGSQVGLKRGEVRW